MILVESCIFLHLANALNICYQSWWIMLKENLKQDLNIYFFKTMLNIKMQFKEATNS